MNTLKQFLFFFGFLYFSVQANSQVKMSQTDKLQKLDRPAYKIFSVCGNKVPEMSEEELSLFAKTFSMAHGAFGSQIAGLKTRNSSIILVNYMNSTYTRPIEEELRMAEGVKPALCMTLAALLDSDISSTVSHFKLKRVSDKEPMKVLASTTTEATSSFPKNIVFWIGIEGELMRVKSFNSATGEVIVERGYAGTNAASHGRNKLVFSPVYVGQKGRRGGTAGNYQDGFQTQLRYCYDPFSDDGNKILANLVLERIKNGYDGAWLDTFNHGDFNLADCFGNACRPWDWKNALKNPGGPVQFLERVFRDGQEHKIRYIQEYVKSKIGSYPVLIANNIRGEDLLDTVNDLMMGKLLLSTPKKPRPLDGFCMENFMAQAQNSIETFENNMLSLRTGIKMDLAVMPVLDAAGAKAITEDSPARTAFEEFGYAFYLLSILPDQNQRKSMFGTYAVYFSGSERHIKVHPQYFWPIGKPKDNWTKPEQYKDYDIGYSNRGVYRREFDNAIVLVNSNQTNKLVDLDGSYFDPVSGDKITSVEMAKTSGKILLRQPLAP
jgi:hypothetical protein